jgi:nitroimidazol reductase NimA-like FMN-containing flavoprotein (pyridoxamine 5'-phosphate oxidase superfamily)
MLREISEERCWSLLEQKHVGRLAVAVMNRPDVFPVNYEVDGHTVVIRTAAGQKLAAAVLGTAVAFEVDALEESSGTGWSIVVKGHASEIERLDDYLDAEDLAIQPWAGGKKLRYMKIDPTEITGREIPDEFAPT